MASSPLLPVPVVLVGHEVRPPPTTLTVVTWNIAWAQGWGSELSGRATLRTPAEQDRALEHMARTLLALDADVVFLQEVDLYAARSGYVDQARTLAERARYRYVAAAPSWDVAYLPYPYWPPTRHTGRVRSGGAILSRHPLSAAWIELLPKPTSHPGWYRPFYPHRYLMGARLDAGQGRRVQLVQTHLEAYDGTNRQLQAGILATRLAALVHEPFLVFGGDLNTVPPDAPVRHGYPDEAHTDHRADSTYARVIATPGLRAVVDPPRLAADPAAFHTFPAHAPNRMLDHLFVGPSLAVQTARVVREAGAESDHLPLCATLGLLSRS